MNKFNFIMLPIIFLLGSGFSVFAQNTVAEKEMAKIEKLARGADVIVTAKVTERKSNWNENKTRIYTRATLRVDEYIKGNGNGDVVEVTYPGGEVGEVGEIYSHMPRFEENEEVLVFLKKDKQLKGFKVFDGEEGKISVVRDIKSNEKISRSSNSVRALKRQINKYLEQE
jgi:hypothetical protein